jgi:ribosomal protein S18 acetylase RimI-like enzyme
MAKRFPVSPQKPPHLTSMQAAAADPSLLFPDPPLESLTTSFGHLALRRGLALKFPRDVTPFAALLENTAAAVTDLHALLEPGESTWIASPEPPPSIPGIAIGHPYPVRQFEWPSGAPLPPLSPDIPIEPLTSAHAAEMVDLTEIAFPGFFRIRTCQMGPYFGIRSASGTGNNAGGLVAMCGERMNILLSPDRDFHEISGLCTHPDHRGRGYAPALLAHALHRNHAAGQRSYLHVASTNPTAIALYERLGFLPRGQFHLHPIRREP